MSEHTKLFIRRSEARTMLGVSEEVFTALVGASLTPVYLKQACRRCGGKKCRRCGGKGTVQGPGVLQDGGSRGAGLQEKLKS